jgi:hypothetical protein
LFSAIKYMWSLIYLKINVQENEKSLFEDLILMHLVFILRHKTWKLNIILEQHKNDLLGQGVIRYYKIKDNKKL